MRILISSLLMLVLLASCGGRRMSPEQLQHKLDSVHAIENAEHLRLQGINLEESDNPLRLFFDSLEIQTLPVSYSENYVTILSGYKPVPAEVVSYMNLEVEREPRAITLPESVGTRLMLLATDEGDNRYSLWLYSLDDEYYPVDRLCLYAVDDATDEPELREEEDDFLQYFSITSDYEIHLLDYAKEHYQAKLEEVYHVDESRHFVLSKSWEEE